jgi:hypothetical protein
VAQREPKRRRRRRTAFWFAVYTFLLFAIGVLSVATQKWSVAGTTLAIGAVFFLITRWLARRGQ